MFLFQNIEMFLKQSSNKATDILNPSDYSNPRHNAAIEKNLDSYFRTKSKHKRKNDKKVADLYSTKEKRQKSKIKEKHSTKDAASKTNHKVRKKSYTADSLKTRRKKSQQPKLHLRFFDRGLNLAYNLDGMVNPSLVFSNYDKNERIPVDWSFPISYKRKKRYQKVAEPASGVRRKEDTREDMFLDFFKNAKSRRQTLDINSEDNHQKYEGVTPSSLFGGVNAAKLEKVSVLGSGDPPFRARSKRNDCAEPKCDFLPDVTPLLSKRTELLKFIKNNKEYLADYNFNEQNDK